MRPGSGARLLLSAQRAARSRARQKPRWPPGACEGSKGTWCSGITPAQHAGGPGLNPQCVHLLEKSRTTLLRLASLAAERTNRRSVDKRAGSLHWGLSPGPSVYRTDALPLSYRGLQGSADRWALRAPPYRFPGARHRAPHRACPSARAAGKSCPHQSNLGCRGHNATS